MTSNYGFVSSVCHSSLLLFLVKLRWPKRKNERIMLYVSKNANLNLLPCCRYIVAGICSQLESVRSENENEDDN